MEKKRTLSQAIGLLVRLGCAYSERRDDVLGRPAWLAGLDVLDDLRRCEGKTRIR